MIAVVKYRIATYSGEISISCDPDDDNDVIKAKARAKLNRLYGPIPFGSEAYQIIERS